MLTFTHVKYGKLHFLKLGETRCSSWSRPSRGRAKLFRQVTLCNARKFSSTPTARRAWSSYVLVFALGFLGSIGFAWVKTERVTSVIDPTTFKPFLLDSKKRVSSTSSIFTLSPDTRLSGSGSYNGAWQKGVWSVQIKQPQLQIARAYTPLPPSHNEEESGRLNFLIRQDPKGEVSGYLHKLPQGAKIDLRGPHVEYQIPADVTEILFIAGGTGIAPALQVAHTLYIVRKGQAMVPKMHILWANRRREDCEGGMNDRPSEPSSWFSGWSSIFAPQVANASKATEHRHVELSPLVRLLEDFKIFQSGQISTEYFVDEEQSTINEAVLRNYLRFSGETVEKDSKGRKLILISGPDGFVKHFAGGKVWQNGKEVQGPLAGILSQIDHSGWEVWKL